YHSRLIELTCRLRCSNSLRLTHPSTVTFSELLGNVENLRNTHQSPKFVLTDTGQSRGCHASTFGANRPSSKLARQDLSGQISRNTIGGPCEDTLVGGSWRMAKAFQYCARHFDLRKFVANPGQFSNRHLAIAVLQALLTLFSLLRCEETEPDVAHFLAL